MNRNEIRRTEAERARRERERERASILALHEAGRPCGRRNCPTCQGFAEALSEEWA